MDYGTMCYALVESMSQILSIMPSSTCLYSFHKKDKHFFLIKIKNGKVHKLAMLKIFATMVQE